MRKRVQKTGTAELLHRRDVVRVISAGYVTRKSQHARRSRIVAFVLSGLLLNITPGPDTAYIIGRSIQFGWRGGAAAALGISTGCLVHISCAAIGLSALLMASSAAFTLKNGSARPICW
jgi:hypothetical protein